MTPKIELTQAIRQAFVEYENSASIPLRESFGQAVLRGERDSSPMLQAFARHTQAAEARGRAEGYEQAIRDAAAWIKKDALTYHDFQADALPSRRHLFTSSSY